MKGDLGGGCQPSSCHPSTRCLGPALLGGWGNQQHSGLRHFPRRGHPGRPAGLGRTSRASGDCRDGQAGTMGQEWRAPARLGEPLVPGPLGPACAPLPCRGWSHSFKVTGGVGHVPGSPWFPDPARSLRGSVVPGSRMPGSHQGPGDAGYHWRSTRVRGSHSHWGLGQAGLGPRAAPLAPHRASPVPGRVKVGNKEQLRGGSPPPAPSPRAADTQLQPMPR